MNSSFFISSILFLERIILVAGIDVVVVANDSIFALFFIMVLNVEVAKFDKPLIKVYRSPFTESNVLIISILVLNQMLFLVDFFSFSLSPIVETKD